MPSVSPQKLLTILCRNFDLTELKKLCFGLSIDYEDLKGATITEKSIELIQFAERRGRYDELVEAVWTERPNAFLKSSPSTAYPELRKKWRSNVSWYWVMICLIFIPLFWAIVSKLSNHMFDNPESSQTIQVSTQLPVAIDRNPPPTDAELDDVWVREQDQMTMVFVPGNTSHNKGNDALVDFWIDKTEVTIFQYNLCQNAGGCESQMLQIPPPGEEGHLPQAFTTWKNAYHYCEWVGGQLPTASQWQYAARGPERHKYPWGDEFDGMKVNSAENDDSYVKASPVGSFPDGRSWVGAEDMAGNVMERVYDNRSVLLGGSWHTNKDYIEIANRFPAHEEYEGADMGFRCIVLAGE